MDSMERSSDGANMGGGDVDTHQVVEHSRKNPVVLAWTPEEEAYERTHQVSAVTSEKKKEAGFSPHVVTFPLLHRTSW